MAGQNIYTTITGLWEKDTKRGKVLSARLSDANRVKLLDLIADPGKLFEVCVFVNNRRDRETSSTHNLVLVEQGAARMPQEPREAEPASTDAGTSVRGRAWRGEAGTSPKSADESDDIPF